MDDDLPTFGPSAFWDALYLRADMLKRLRSFFDECGFLEVETPLLSADTVVDRYIEPIPVIVFGEPSASKGHFMYLQTSPEFAMKRLMASGATAIFQICKAFRGDEQGRLHNLEFTMVEWYRAGDGYQEGMQFLSDLAHSMLARGAAERLSYREAFVRYAGLDPFEATTESMAEKYEVHFRERVHAERFRDVSAEFRRHVSAEREVHERAREEARRVAPESLSLADRDGWLNLLLSEFVEPNLGRERPTILYDYPASQAALARVRNDDPPVAERFELYVRGIELANGYHELLDPAILRARNAENNRLRQSEGRTKLPESSRLLAAMDHGLPDCTGVALGFDRLVMIAAGASSLAEVIAFSADIA